MDRLLNKWNYNEMYSAGENYTCAFYLTLVKLGTVPPSLTWGEVKAFDDKFGGRATLASSEELKLGV